MLNKSSIQGIQEGNNLQVNKSKTVKMADVIPLPKKQRQEMVEKVKQSKKKQCRKPTKIYVNLKHQSKKIKK